MQVTKRVVKNNKVLTPVIEFKLREEGWRSAENTDKVIGLRQVSCGNPRNFIALFYSLCYFPAAPSNRQEHDYWSWMTNSCFTAPADIPKQMNYMIGYYLFAVQPLSLVNGVKKQKALFVRVRSIQCTSLCIFCTDCLLSLQSFICSTFTHHCAHFHEHFYSTSKSTTSAFDPHWCFQQESNT